MFKIFDKLLQRHQKSLLHSKKLIFVMKHFRVAGAYDPIIVAMQNYGGRKNIHCAIFT